LSRLGFYPVTHPYHTVATLSYMIPLVPCSMWDAGNSWKRLRILTWALNMHHSQGAPLHWVTGIAAL